MDKNLSKLGDSEGQGAWHVVVRGVAKSQIWQQLNNTKLPTYVISFLLL